jgi:hypothetical protein
MRPNPLRWSLRRRAAVGLLALAALGVGTGLTLGGGETLHPRARPVDKGIWISRAELAALPMSGGAWRHLRQVADGDLGKPDVANQNSTHDVTTLAVALVYARTGKARYREKAVDAIRSAMGTEDGARTLAVGRNLAAYVIAADLVNLRGYAPGIDRAFRSWIGELRRKQFGGRTLVSTHELRPNNWGTMAGASRVAIDAYLGDEEDRRRAAQVFRGWLGDRDAYHGFVFGRDSWQLDPDNPVAIAPVGATRDGLSLDGALLPEMRRGGEFRIPPKHTSYPWGALAGALVQAQLLARQGYDVWQWEDQALRRAVDFLYRLDEEFGGWWAENDDTWEPWLVNEVYGTSYPTRPAVVPGKNMGWTDWLYPARRSPAAGS